MRTITAATAITAFLPFVSAAVDLSSIPRVTSATVKDGAYIVELANPSNLNKRSKSPHAELYHDLNKRGASWDLVSEYNDPDIFVGASVTLESDEDIAALASVDGVTGIYPVFIHPRPETLNYHVPTGKDDDKLPPDTYSTHRMTGVDKLHDEGYLGKDIKIAVIDTGIDYTHPTLGGGFGPGYKVYMGHDFVGDNYDGEKNAVPDDDPLDQCAGHGTHVAGIIGANLDKEFNFTGVAPEALIGAYRVFGCKGGVGDDVLVDALMRAYRDGNDILSLSLGGAQGWTSAVTAVVASRIAARGRVVTIAAGNDGRYGGWYASAPGVAIDAISVASVENIETTIQTATLSNGHPPIGYGSFKPLNISGQLPIYATSKDTSITNDACEPLGSDIPDLSPYLVIVKRGTCTFVQKLENIKAKGAKAAFIYDNGPGVSGGIAVGNFTAAIITQADGVYLVGEFVAGREVKVSFPQTGGGKTIPSPQGGLMSTFSTFGPVNDLWFKPSLAAPGGNILSTIPVPLGKYAIESGTSMATPFVAGSAALLLQAKGKRYSVYRGVRSMLQSTASVVPSSHAGGDPAQTLAQAGAGLINVYNALHYKTEVTPAELALNDTANARLEHTIKIWNNDRNTQVYTISHEPVGTALTIDGIQPIPAPVPLKSTYATVTSSHKTIRVRPGYFNEFVVKFAPPQGLDPKAFPVYSGHIKIASEKEELRVSYLGVAANTRDLKVIDDTTFYFDVPTPQILSSTGVPQNGTATYTFQDQDWPFLVYRLAAGTADLRIELIDAGGDQKPPTSRAVGEIAAYKYQSRNSIGDAMNNGYNSFAWSKPIFKDGKPVPDGSYKVRIRALRIAGNPRKNEDWDTWTSPVVVVRTKQTGTMTSSSIVSGTSSFTSSSTIATFSIVSSTISVSSSATATPTP